MNYEKYGKIADKLQNILHEIPWCWLCLLSVRDDSIVMEFSSIELKEIERLIQFSKENNLTLEINPEDDHLRIDLSFIE